MSHPLAIVTVKLSQWVRPPATDPRGPHEALDAARLRRQPARDRRPGGRPREGGPGHDLGGRALWLRRPHVDGLPGSEDGDRRDRRRDPQRLLAHPRRPAADRGRARQRLRRPRRDRPRGQRAAGHRGLPRHRLRQAHRPHPRDHRDHPDGPAPRAAGQRRHLQAAAPGGPGPGSRQAPQAAQQARAPRRTPLGRGARRQERRDDGRGRRRMAAVAVPPRQGQGGLGRGAREGQREALPRPGARSRSTPAACSRSART